jgi:NADPH-dependent stearoyl-CoA 9-desaturase
VDSLAASLDSLGRAARARVGSRDLAWLRALKASTILAELAGRLALQFVATAWGWCFGVAALGYSLSVEAQLNHSIMHGAYDGLPGAGPFTKDRYETLAVPFRCRTWRDAHRIHHAHPSLLGKDPDTLHPLFRVHEDVPWRPWHLGNAFLGALFTFEHWAFDYDSFLKTLGGRPRGDRRELGKLLLYVGYQLVLFPALAGRRWPAVLAAGVTAIVLRNLVFTGLQTASSVGARVSTLHPRDHKHADRAAWLRFQIETSKNFALRGPLALVCGGLHRHIEHHLFPALPPTQLAALSPEVRALCVEHGVRYEEHPSFRASLSDSLAHLWRLSSP